MKKPCFILMLFLCISMSTNCLAASKKVKLCGAYFEMNNQGFLRITTIDKYEKHKSCDVDLYNRRLREFGSTLITLDFNKRRSAVSNWRKFDNHLIEVKGRLYRDTLTSTKLVRDFGLR